MIDLSGKVVLVTGGSRGIGAEVVRGAVRAGAEAVIHYASRHQPAQALQAELGAAGTFLVAADLADPAGAARVWDRALAWRGRIDVLVNNAGVYEPAPPGAPDAAWQAAWQRTLAVNLVAAADLCRRAVAHMAGRGGGTIVNVASRAAFRGDGPDYAHYAASKGGMVALTRTLARAYARQNVLVYAVAPGWVRTGMAEESFRTDTDEKAVRADIPIGDIAPPAEVANVVLFLASGLARHATGTTVDVNGASYVR